MSKIRVILIEDSALMRLIISDILVSDGTVEIIGKASNGREGAEMTKNLKPDLVVTDLVMPEYDGVYAIKEILKEQEIPILVLSAAGDASSEIVFEAMQSGASDFIVKPQKEGVGKMRSIEQDILSRIKALVGEKKNVKKSLTGTKITAQHTFATELPFDLFVIGASTGGPGAIEEVVKKLPSNFPVPIVIAQHMPESFITSFSKRLDGISPINIKVAEPGEVLRPQNIYIAPAAGNPKIVKAAGRFKFELTDEQFKEYNGPSVDSLFLSAAEICKNRLVGLIMTGMGRDGAIGMKKIKDLGGMTVGQDESTCVVYGMPGAAEKIGALDYQVKLKDIASFVVSSFS